MSSIEGSFSLSEVQPIKVSLNMTADSGFLPLLSTELGSGWLGERPLIGGGGGLLIGREQ